MVSYLQKYFYYIIGGFLFLVMLLEINYLNDNTVDEISNNDTLALITEEEQPEHTDTFWIEIKGAVVHPNVYEVTEENIINDIITEAGGFTADAYTDNLNLSQKVEKQMVINIYTKKDYQKIKNGNPYDKCYVASYNISDCLDNGYSLIVTDDTKVTDFTSKVETKNTTSNVLTKVNINTADESKLTLLPGIGSAKALAIITYRNTNGKFKTIEDIQNVSGIGASTFEKIKSYLTI